MGLFSDLESSDDENIDQESEDEVQQDSDDEGNVLHDDDEEGADFNATNENIAMPNVKKIIDLLITIKNPHLF